MMPARLHVVRLTALAAMLAGAGAYPQGVSGGTQLQPSSGKFDGHPVNDTAASIHVVREESFIAALFVSKAIAIACTKAIAAKGAVLAVKKAAVVTVKLSAV